MIRLIVACILLLMACGCQTLDQMVASRLDFVSHSALNYAPRPPDYPVDIFFEGNPAKEYEIIGDIVGFVDQGSQVRPWLAIRVRQVGGDGAINIATDVKTKKATEIVDVRTTDSRGHDRNIPVAKTRYFDVLKVTAKVIRYK